MAGKALSKPDVTDFEKYQNLTGDRDKELKVDFKPLNFDRLFKAGAFRVTHQGLDGDKYNPDPQAGFSLVSRYNDAVGQGGGTAKWKDNPHAYDVVRRIFTEMPQNLAPHKYLQIIESARDLGLKDKDIFAPVKASGGIVIDDGNPAKQRKLI
jgi:hypothetical protein